jgi:chromosome segregation ATPase
MNNFQQRKITIYIHPEQGPVMPMVLDLMEVELAALKQPGTAQRDEARIKEIARRIKAEFKDVRPEERRNELAPLVRQFGDYQELDRLVLRLPGVIQSSKDQNGRPAADIKKQLDQFTKQIEQLTRRLRQEQDEHEKTKLQVATLKSNYQSLHTLYGKINTQLADAQMREQQARQEVERLHRKAVEVENDFHAALQENGSIQTELEGIKRAFKEQVDIFAQQRQDWTEKEQAWLEQEGELSRLRIEARESKQEIENLNETIRSWKNRFEALRRQLSDDDPTLTGASTARGVFDNL